MFADLQNRDVQHRGDITPLNPIEARYVVSLAMSALSKCREFDPDTIIGVYTLSSGRSVVLRACIRITDDQFGVAFDAGEVPQEDTEEVNGIHESIVGLIPVLAEGLPKVREVA